MSKIDDAARLYQRFSGHRAQHVDHFTVPDHDTYLLVGETEGIAYNTIRDGKRERYVHEFRQESRPLLTASHDGTQLYLLDGAYRFTDRGIVDKGRKMPAEIAIVNPSRRKSRKHRTAAQKAATRKMLAARWGRRVASHAHVNPKRRAKKRHTAHHYFHRGRSSNPVKAMSTGLVSDLVPATIGAAGGLGVNVLVGYLPLPATMKTGFVRSLVVLAGVGLAGWAASRFVGRRFGAALTAGGVTVTLYDMIKGFIVQQFPNIPLAPTAVVSVPTAAITSAPGVSGWISPAQQMNDMGTYVDGMGDPGQVVRAY